jgi:lytic murein transglycosylase
MLRPSIALAVTLLASLAAQAADPFAAWLEATVWPAAKSAGVSRPTFEAAVSGLTPDTSLPDLGRDGGAAIDYQAEFRSPAGYLDAGKLAAEARRAADRLVANAAVLRKVEAETGVPAAVLVAVWGKESAYGAAPLPKDAVRTLATQAYMGSRKAEFLPELVAALRILEEGHLRRADLRSSWAGALGQPQFMPSKFLAYAVDEDGDGRRDIWSSVPDVLGSIGRFLQASGWRAGVPWGREVVLPAAVSCALEGPDAGRPIADWNAAGVRTTGGRPLTAKDTGPVGHLLMPAGRYGPAFLVSDNFYVLKAYNESDVYALWVGTLADRLAGRAGIAGRFADARGFTRGDVRALQERLIALGNDVGGADGLVGWRTRVAIGRWQAAHAASPTCFPDRDVINALTKSRSGP